MGRESHQDAKQQIGLQLAFGSCVGTLVCVSLNVPMSRVLLLTQHLWGCSERASLILQPINKEEFSTIFGPAAMHAVGHVAANLSFAAVAISLTHTVKTLEPAFNVLLSKIFLGVGTPLPVVSTLIPIMVRTLQTRSSQLM